jgi:hypothetical protein
MIIGAGILLNLFISEQILMATDAIIHDHLLPRFLDKNNLGFFSEREDCGMPDPVFCFKKVLVKHIVMWHMTIVAIGPVPV